MILSGESLSAEAAVSAGLALELAKSGKSVDEAIAHGRALASHPLPALMANKRLLRHGHTDAVLDAWQRERETMADLAERIGPLGRRREE
jgi:enoyl-CoA hydratase/carnithine racemase